MKVSEVNIIYTRVIQMRQFEPATISVSMKAQVDPGDKPESVAATCKNSPLPEISPSFVPIGILDTNSFEIIGNIYENTELLK